FDGQVFLAHTWQLEAQNQALLVLEKITANHRPASCGHKGLIIDVSLIGQVGGVTGTKTCKRTRRELGQMLPALGQVVPERANVLFNRIEFHTGTSAICNGIRAKSMPQVS